MGPFMVEIVFCRVTRRGRKKKKGMNKLARENCRNDGPAFQFVPPEDTVKITLDLSEGGPVFSALDEMMMKMMDDDAAERKKSSKGGSEAKNSLKRLLKSGIPGIEKMFAGPGGAGGGPPGMKKQTKGFHKMNDGSKQKFMKAIFGEDGTSIDTGTAAALLAATCSGGDPEIGDKIAQLLVPEMGEKVDPSMMAALMSSCSMINAGATTEEVLKAMQTELKNSGMSEEDILRKTQVLMKAFGREESSSMAEYSLASKQKNSALKLNGTSPKDFATAVMVQKAIAACGSTPENFAKVLMIENQLAKRGAQSRHIADALKNLGDFENKRAEMTEKLKKAINEEKLKKDDVFLNVRMCQALDNENEPTWKEVKNMKDILQGCSPNSPEAIELNLARATKTAGLNKNDMTAALMAQKTMAALGTDPMQMAKVCNIQKVIAENGVPAVEIARVLADGTVPKDPLAELAHMAEEAYAKDFNAADVDCFVKLYDNLRLKSNIPMDVVDHIDKTLIQVRCSLEDVADNLVSSQLARGEKENQVVRSLCSTLHNTGASPEIVGTTMVGSLRKVIVKPECDIMKDVGRAMNEDGFETPDVTKAMGEVLINLHEENPDLREDLGKAMETVLKECGGFPDEIRQIMDDVMPPEPPRPMSPRLAAELERLRAEDEAREAEKARKAAQGISDSSDDIDFGDEEAIKNKKLKNPALAAVMSDSRRGSLLGSRRGSSSRSRAGSISLGGVERRGSYYGDDVSKRSTVAVVVDDPDGKKQMEKELEAVFNGADGSVVNGTDNTSTTNMVPVTSPDGTQHLVDANTAALLQAGADISQVSSTASGHPGVSSSGLVNGGGHHQEMVDGILKNVEKLGALLDDVSFDGSPDEVRDQLQDRLRSGSGSGDMSEDEIKKLMSVFETSGVISNIGGVHKFRTVDDMKETMMDTEDAYHAAMDQSKNRKLPGLSDENRRLMEEILRKSVADQQDIGTRVAALLAGTSLTTTSGTHIRKRESIEEVSYQTIGDSSTSQARRSRDFVAPKIAPVRVPSPSPTPAPVQRPSIMRQSQSLSRLRKLSESQKESQKEEASKRHITGLRRAKVPLMVYSCGGFTRCFRIARYYSTEGPPIGVTYDRNTRQALNPELNP